MRMACAKVDQAVAASSSSSASKATASSTLNSQVFTAMCQHIGAAITYFDSLRVQYAAVYDVLQLNSSTSVCHESRPNSVSVRKAF